MAKWLGFWAFTAMVWVQSLVGELRPHKPQGAAKKKKGIIRQRQISYYITYMWILKEKNNDTNVLIYNTETDSQRKQTNDYQRGNGGGIN